MGAIWTLHNKFQKWLDVEIAVCEVHNEDGIIPAEDLENIKSKAAFTVERVNEIEKTTDHDVIAFTTNLAENIGESARFVHYGLTSSDVVDTANALLLKEACELLLTKTDALLEVLKRRAFEFKDTPQIGRTHGIHAEPTSFGMTFALWFSEMKRNRKRDLKERRKQFRSEKFPARSVRLHILILTSKKESAKNSALQRRTFPHRSSSATVTPNISRRSASLPEHLKKSPYKFAIGREPKSAKRRKNSRPDKKAHRRCLTNEIRSCRKRLPEWRKRFART